MGESPSSSKPPRCTSVHRDSQCCDGARGKRAVRVGVRLRVRLRVRVRLRLRLRLSMRQRGRGRAARGRLGHEAAHLLLIVADALEHVVQRLQLGPSWAAVVNADPVRAAALADLVRVRGRGRVRARARGRVRGRGRVRVELCSTEATKTEASIALNLMMRAA